MTSQNIIVPHDLSRGPLKAVRRMLVHSSISGLQADGLYERYCSLLPANALEQINSLIGPGWMPVELVLEHYRACDQLGLSERQITVYGLRAGDEVGNALLLSNNQANALGAQTSVWSKVLAFSRMGRRIHEGSSAQYEKLGEDALLIEHKGNPLYSVTYYRIGHLGFLRNAFSRVGIEITDLKISHYRSVGACIETRLRWK
jgi:hypothetical protein